MIVFYSVENLLSQAPMIFDLLAQADLPPASRWQDIKNIVEVASQLAAAIGVFLIWIQLNSNANSTKADFAMRLDSRLSEYRETTKKLLEGGPWYHGEIDDVSELEQLLAFFDTLGRIGSNNILAYEQLDGMFGYRFFIITHNPRVKSLIRGKRTSWPGLTSLYRELMSARIRAARTIPREECRWDDNF